MEGQAEGLELHITEADLLRDLRVILQEVERGTEVIIERDSRPIAVLRPATPMIGKRAEAVALLPDVSEFTLEGDFVPDVKPSVPAPQDTSYPFTWD